MNGSVWSQKFPTNHPSARYSMGMTYDSARGRVILYGGITDAVNTKSAETWAYDGQNWQLLAGNSPPGAREGLSLAYDSARDRTVLFGGGTALEAVTWEFDGTSWMAKATPFQPDGDRCWNPIAYDSKREVVYLFGGRDCVGSIYHNDTWAYGPDPDGDGIVGGLDNCPNAVNANQANGDGDVAGDACDCAPADGGSFAQPVEVTSLRAAAGTNLSWDDQAPFVGPNVIYDLATGGLAALRAAGSFSGATCLANNLTSPGYADARVPQAGDGFYYLARSANACGTGTYGSGSNGGPRAIGACP